MVTTLVAQEDDLFEDTSFKAVAHNGIGPELIAFSLLGVCCGVRCTHVARQRRALNNHGGGPHSP